VQAIQPFSFADPTGWHAEVNFLNRGEEVRDITRLLGIVEELNLPVFKAQKQSYGGLTAIVKTNWQAS
jgi:hypothetical protein